MDNGLVRHQPKLSIYQSMHELWAVTKRKKLWFQATKVSFLHKGDGLDLTDRLRSDGGSFLLK